jgi:serine/threonine protein kinase/tetratricopeptide (TPR) repeat protein
LKKQSDNSIAEVIQDPTECPQCGAVTRLDYGTCINCLLREGLEAKGEASREAFESVLVEDDVTDTEWRLGHYEILEEIGRGGMGVIYRARQQHSRRIVAVKRIFAHDVNSHETLVRFRREAEAVASLDHPNILPIHEVSESEEGLPFFSMKYATGGSLRAAAPTLRKDLRKCVRLMAKVARAIDYAHGKGVLHRDLQPGNILLDENGEPMVSDFGLAKWLDQDSDLTRTLETLGTPGYIAPEQAESRTGDLTSAADIYSLGAILFYLLTGRPPFVGPNVLSVIRQAAATPAPRLRSLVPSLDRDLETIVARCLESDPKARYQSAAALADDLDHWLRHEPIRARRTGAFTRGRKWVRRNPTSGLLAASVIALAAVIGWNVWKGEFIRPLVTNGIAVLPFENLSSDPENTFLSDGVQDEVLNDLAKIANLKVISRTSVMQYKSGGKRNLRQIARELGVAHVVEGSVQRIANRVRVSAQLIDAKTDTHLWVESYDRPLDDVFAIQSDIAKAIADQLQAKLSPNEKSAIDERPTKDLVAYDFYLRAKSLVMKGVGAPENLFEPARLLDQAVARDPNFFLAYCLLSKAHTKIYMIYDHTPARRDLAERAVKAALHLRPEAGEAHLELARYLRCNLDYDNARAELALSQRKLPNNAEVFELAAAIDERQGRWTEGVRNWEKTLELDPHNLSNLHELALEYRLMRRFAEAAATEDRAIALAPEDAGLRTDRASLDLEWRADPKPLHKIFPAIFNENPAAAAEAGEYCLDLALCERDPVLAERALAAIGDGFNWNQLFFPVAFLKRCVARVFGDEAVARKAFTAARAEVERTVDERPDEGPPLCVLGLIDAGLGRNEEAIREGRRASELLPVSKDAIDGAYIMQFLGVIYAWAGEKDLAIKQIAATLQVASGLSYGELRLHPFWDPLRGDPRFEKLVEESKKPVALK